MMDAPRSRFMDPTKLECRGLFGYGSGFMMREYQTLREAFGSESVMEACVGCPISEECYLDSFHGRTFEESGEDHEFNTQLGLQNRELMHGKTTKNGYVRVTIW